MIDDRELNRPLVIYHANCWDGFCAAWLFKARFPQIEMLPAQYGNKPPDVSGRSVFVVDFSYDRPTTIAMSIQAKDLVVLDHHKTAQESLAGLEEECGRLYGSHPQIVFDMTKSGGRLAWEYLHGRSTKSHWLVDYTEDRDLWLHKLPYTKEINANLRSMPLTVECWDGLLYKRPHVLIPGGEAILRFQAELIDHHVRKAHEVDIVGHKVLAVNATTMVSEIAQELASGRPFGATYFLQQGQRTWSLRSDENGIDVSEVAKQFGGGGHFHAAGFQEKL